jgi:hypothetical protein
VYNQPAKPASNYFVHFALSINIRIRSSKNQVLPAILKKFNNSCKRISKHANPDTKSFSVNLSITLKLIVFDTLAVSLYWL